MRRRNCSATIATRYTRSLNSPKPRSTNPNIDCVNIVECIRDLASSLSFIFIFLFVVYGFWTKESMRCPACMRGTAWKMFAINLLFVLGTIPSIYQLIRAYASDKVGGVFSGLHTANLKATKRDYSAATKIYQSILERVPVAAGIHYNLGLALVQNQEWERASAAFELSLDDCSNYRYAAGGLTHCYETLGRKEELSSIQKLWGVAEGEEL